MKTNTKSQKKSKEIFGVVPESIEVKMSTGNTSDQGADTESQEICAGGGMVEGCNCA